MMNFKGLVFSLFVVLSLGACKGQQDDSSATVEDSISNQVGEAMASIDESGGSSGAYAWVQGELKFFARLAPEQTQPPRSLLPQAFAASCTSTWGSCSSNVITRTFNGCSFAGLTYNGNVTLTFNDGATNNVCLMSSSGHSITRDPEFSITSLRGASYSVSKTGTYGQRLTRGADDQSYTFSSDGIRRTVSWKGTTIADFTTSTTSAMTVQGKSRSGRVLSGGTLHVLNNLNSESCDLVPSGVTWSSTCNCAASGSWTVSCSNGKSGTLAIQSCGSGQLTLNGTSESVSFDRCGSL